jgi:hypothetical protein
MENKKIIIEKRKDVFIIKKRFLFFWWRTEQELIVPSFTRTVSDTYYKDLEFTSYEDAKKYINKVYGK